MLSADTLEITNFKLHTAPAVIFRLTNIWFCFIFNFHLSLNCFPRIFSISFNLSTKFILQQQGNFQPSPVLTISDNLEFSIMCKVLGSYSGIYIRIRWSNAHNSRVTERIFSSCVSNERVGSEGVQKNKKLKIGLKKCEKIANL